MTASDSTPSMAQLQVIVKGIWLKLCLNFNSWFLGKTLIKEFGTGNVSRDAGAGRDFTESTGSQKRQIKSYMLAH